MVQGGLRWKECSSDQLLMPATGTGAESGGVCAIYLLSLEFDAVPVAERATLGQLPASMSAMVLLRGRLLSSTVSLKKDCGAHSVCLGLEQ